MTKIETLINRIIDRVNVNLREPAFDVDPYVRNLIPPEKFGRFYAFYGLTPHHPLHFQFSHSSLAGSYFLGKCIVDHSVLYKSDIRGDELKSKGDRFNVEGLEIPLHEDETIHIKDSFLIKTLVHSYSHDPESPEEFLIQNTVSMNQANIHGSPVEGSFLGPFSTVDLTTIHDCVIGAYAYLQVGELAHQAVEPGKIWLRTRHAFDCVYRYPQEVVDRYIRIKPGEAPKGILMDFVESRKEDFSEVFSSVHGISAPVQVPSGTSVSHFAVVRGQSSIGENVVAAQRAYLEDAWLGKGSNAQENTHIIHSRLEGYNVTAHGAKILHAHLGSKVFVGFNSFLNGKPECRLAIGQDTIVMPHTIIDPEEPIEIPAGQLVWGHIRSPRDLREHMVSFENLVRVEGEIRQGNLHFQGSGARFLSAFRNRIERILRDNGAHFDGTQNLGHAQKSQMIAFNTIQPYPEGSLKGLYPTIEIRP